MELLTLFSHIKNSEKFSEKRLTYSLGCGKINTSGRILMKIRIESNNVMMLFIFSFSFVTIGFAAGDNQTCGKYGAIRLIG